MLMLIDDKSDWHMIISALSCSCTESGTYVFYQDCYMRRRLLHFETAREPKKNAFWLAFNLNCGIPFKLMNSQQTQKNAKISNPPASFFYMTHEFFSVHIHSTNKNQNKNALVGSFIKCPEINSI